MERKGAFQADPNRPFTPVWALRAYDRAPLPMVLIALPVLYLQVNFPSGVVFLLAAAFSAAGVFMFIGLPIYALVATEVSRRRFVRRLLADTSSPPPSPPR